MNRNNQLSLDLPEMKNKRRKLCKLQGEIYFIFLNYTGFILCNLIGTLIKTKDKIKSFDFILCDDEKIADEILNCVPKAKSRKYFKVPNFKPLLYSGIDKSSVQLWISAVERKMGFKKSIYFRVVNSRWDY
ncbi:hypothetical protein ACT4WO_20055 (plasmid) [Acinetobacter baumannii]